MVLYNNIEIIDIIEGMKKRLLFIIENLNI